MTSLRGFLGTSTCESKGYLGLAIIHVTCQSFGTQFSEKELCGFPTIWHPANWHNIFKKTPTCATRCTPSQSILWTGSRIPASPRPIKGCKGCGVKTRVRITANPSRFGTPKKNSCQSPWICWWRWIEKVTKTFQWMVILCWIWSWFTMVGSKKTQTILRILILYRFKWAFFKTHKNQRRLNLSSKSVRICSYRHWLGRGVDDGVTCHTKKKTAVSKKDVHPYLGKWSNLTSIFSM